MASDVWGDHALNTQHRFTTLLGQVMFKVSLGIRSGRMVGWGRTQIGKINNAEKSSPISYTRSLISPPPLKIQGQYVECPRGNPLWHLGWKMLTCPPGLYIGNLVVSWYYLLADLNVILVGR